MPGLLAVVPPRRTARGRERDQFIAYLMLSGNATFSPADLLQITNDAAGSFYQAHGPLTSAMRKAADQINARLLERMRAWRYRPYRTTDGEAVPICTAVTFIYRVR